MIKKQKSLKNFYSPSKTEIFIFFYILCSNLEQIIKGFENSQKRQPVFIFSHSRIIFSILIYTLLFFLRKIFVLFGTILTLFVFVFFRKISILSTSILTLFVLLSSERSWYPSLAFSESFLCFFNNIQPIFLYIGRKL